VQICPDEAVMLAYIEGGLSPDLVDTVDAHLDGCATCRRVLLFAAGSPELDATTPADTPDAPAAPTGAQIGRYVVRDVLGRGGMGIVYAAFDPELDRKVAVKVLRGERAGEHATARLLREGRAIARLAHPNVVTVFDVGTHDGSVFVAMELVDGTSLDHYLDTPRPWRDVLDLFVQAGHGLIAAHQAGIIHRDFKPANVLVGKDGRVRVTDFGLARLEAAERPSRPPADLGAAGSLTRTGAVMGTPAYMAPEQFEAHAVDERTDQFSFAVALYEALYGARPYQGATAAAIYAQIVAGDVIAPPAGSQVPARVRAIVLRGLAAKPDERYATLGEMLEALDRLRRRSAPRWIAAALVPIAVVSTYAIVRAKNQDVCGGAQPKLAQVWNDQTRADVRRAFIATGKPYAPAAFEQAASAIDRYASAWVDMHVDACRATAVREEQSEEMLDLRMTCLDQRRNQLRAIVDVLAHADAAVVEHANDAVSHLGELAPCADAEALRAPVPLPASLLLRAEVDALRSELARAGALADAGKARDAIRFVPAIVASARTVGYRPLEAEALNRLGNLQYATGDAKHASESLHAAVLVAEAAGDQLSAAKAWRASVFTIGLGEGDYPAALDAAEHARAILGRLDPDGLEIAELDNSLSTVLRDKGEPAAARDAAHRAIAIFERKLPPGDPKTARAVANLGTIEGSDGHRDKAIALYERARTDLERALGPEHPLVAKVLGNLAHDYARLGKYAEARAVNTREIAIDEAALGREHPDLIAAYNTLGNIDDDQERDADAIAAYTHALEIADKVLGHDHPTVSAVLGNLAIVEHRDGKLADARAHLERALAIDEKRVGPDNVSLATTISNLSSVAIDEGKVDEARRFAERALAIRIAKRGPQDALVAHSYVALANVETAAGKHAEAIALLEKAIPIEEQAGERPQLAVTLYNYGNELLAIDQFARAEAALRRALAIFETEAPDGVQTAEILTVLAATLDRRGRATEAAPLIERALAIRAKSQQSPRELAETRATAARILWQTSRDHSRAIELARQALPVLAISPSSEDHRAQLAKWMAERHIH
jgi:tetratricopeptide (TPR) repeat protein